MSQLGRCSCGTHLVKSNVVNRSTGENISVDLCPLCDDEKLQKKIGPYQKGFASSSANLDRFGYEKLEK